MNLILKVNGVEYGGWKDINIGAGIDRVCRDFTLSITWKWAGNTNVLNRIKPFDLCEVWIDGDKIITGYIYSAPINYSADTVQTTITGRSLTSSLVDCSAIGNSQYRKRKAGDVITAIAKEYGVKVIDNSGSTELLDFVIEKGEKCFEAFQRIIKNERLLITDNGDGELVLANVGELKADDALVLGKNILACNAENNWSEVYSEYRVNSQSASGAPNEADDDDADSHNVEGGFTFERSIKNELPIKRVLVIKSDGKSSSAQLNARLEFEKLNRLGKAKERTYTVQGWRQSNGKLWLPNMLVEIDDWLAGVTGQMLITEVSYRVSNGHTAELKLSSPEGYGEFKERVVKKNKDTGDKWAFVPKGT